MNELTIKTPAALDLSRIKNVALLKESTQLSKLQEEAISGAMSTIANIEAIRRKQAVILDRIQRAKLYEKDGFKSLAEYAEGIGLEKSNAHALAAAGKVYNDKDAPEKLKALSPSKLAAISATLKADKEQVYSDAIAGKLDDMTQKQLKDYASAVKNSKTSGKTEVVKTYTATDHTGTQFTPEDDNSPNGDYTIGELEKAFSDMGELVKLPKGKVSPDSDKATLMRYLSIVDGVPTIYTLHEFTAPRVNITTTGDPRDNFIKNALKLNMTSAAINMTCAAMGWAPYQPEQTEPEQPEQTEQK